MDIYFQATSNGGYNGHYSIGYQPYLLPRQKHLQKERYGLLFDLFGKKVLFKWVEPGKSVMIPDDELPEDFIYSFKHGLCDIERNCTFKEQLGACNRNPTKEEILEAISQTRMYTHEDVLECQKKYRNYLELKP